MVDSIASVVRSEFALDSRVPNGTDTPVTLTSVWPDALAKRTIDAISSHICVLDESGVIVAVNRAWMEFAQANRKPGNSSSENSVVPGANYLAVCDQVAGPDAGEASSFAAGVRAVLSGELQSYSMEYPCHSPFERRWFIGRVSRFLTDGLPRVAIEHGDITDRKLAEEHSHRAGIEIIERSERERRCAEQTASLYLRMVRTLSLAVEIKDQATGEHLRRVEIYALGLAEELGLPAKEMEVLRAAAVLHDIGKVAIPEHILTKPGPLTLDEFETIKIHPVVGAEIVRRADLPLEVATLVRAHHERWDGTGYPDGLKGEEIPLGARILAAVDSLDALTSERQYRRPMAIDDAMSLIVNSSGQSFDPKVVEALLARYRDLETSVTNICRNSSWTPSAKTTDYRCSYPADQVYSLAEDAALRELAQVNAITSHIACAESVEAGLQGVWGRLRDLIPSDFVALFGKRGKDLECIFAQGPWADLLLNRTIGFGVGASGWTLANRRPLLNGNGATDFNSIGLTPAPPLRLASLSIPLESEFGTIGVLTLYRNVSDPFKTAHLRGLLAVGSSLAYRMNLDLCRQY